MPLCRASDELLHERRAHAPETGDEDLGRSGPRPSASTRDRRSRSVTIPRSSPERTSADETRSSAIRTAGEKGLQITRFKGLGEMNAEELRETTLDPANRTLLQIHMDDASGADDLFRVLMGDQVEPRREFIQKHALDVRNLDV